mmetsp:Transcript_6633/g.19235  ORF Transcript_6633/g.19235 Transcript_6633/m.19235 type:complete len:232 (+) Transcript_6633:473-1168(+)
MKTEAKLRANPPSTSTSLAAHTTISRQSPKWRPLRDSPTTPTTVSVPASRMTARSGGSDSAGRPLPISDQDGACSTSSSSRGDSTSRSSPPPPHGHAQACSRLHCEYTNRSATIDPPTPLRRSTFPYLRSGSPAALAASTAHVSARWSGPRSSRSTARISPRLGARSSISKEPRPEPPIRKPSPSSDGVKRATTSSCGLRVQCWGGPGGGGGGGRSLSTPTASWLVSLWQP